MADAEMIMKTLGQIAFEAAFPLWQEPFKSEPAIIRKQFDRIASAVSMEVMNRMSKKTKPRRKKR